MTKMTFWGLVMVSVFGFSAYANSEKLIITTLNSDIDLQAVKLSEVPLGSFEIQTNSIPMAANSKVGEKLNMLRNRIGDHYESQEKRVIAICDSEIVQEKKMDSYSTTVLTNLENCQFTSEQNFLYLHR